MNRANLTTDLARTCIRKTMPDSFSVQLRRGIRQKIRVANMEEDLRRESVWHKKLQRDLINSRQQLRDQGSNRVTKWLNKQMLDDPEQVDLTEDVDVWYWKRVLNHGERKQLEAYGIKTLDELMEAYRTAKRDEASDAEHDMDVWDKYFYIIDTFEEARTRLLAMSEEMDKPGNKMAGKMLGW